MNYFSREQCLRVYQSAGVGGYLKIYECEYFVNTSFFWTFMKFKLSFIKFTACTYVCCEIYTKMEKKISDQIYFQSVSFQTCNLKKYAWTNLHHYREQLSISNVWKFPCSVLNSRGIFTTFMSILHAENYKFPDILFVDKVVSKKVWWNKRSPARSC